MRRAAVVLVALLAGVIAGLGLGHSAAWAQGEGLQGTITYEDEPVVGAVINVYDEGGQLVGSVETGPDGSWFIEVPGSATYLVQLDETTLPEGLVGATGYEREPFVRPGSVGNVIFRLQEGDGRQPATPAAPSPGAEQPGGGDGEPGEGEPGSGEPGDGEQAGEVPADPEQEPEVVAGRGTLERVVAYVYSGIHFGLLIALAALGLSLVFGTMGLINFSHGELVSFGAIMALLFNVVGVFGFDLPLVVAAPAAVVAGALFGYLQDRYFWGWLRHRGTGLIAMMIISIGGALLLRNAYLYFVGPGRRPYADFAVQRPIEVGPLVVTPKTLITDGIAVVVLVAVALALIMTRLGKATRAVADNPTLAAASGINVDRIIRVVWAIGAGLAALSGVFLAIHETVNYLMGFQMLLLIFAAVVVGGLGTAFGAIVGGLIVGLLIQVSTLWVPNEFKYVIALAALIIVLLVRPQGILGRQVRVG